MQIDGDTVLRFLSGIETAMDNAGRGEHRAFKLLSELKLLGLHIEADPPELDAMLIRPTPDMAMPAVAD